MGATARTRSSPVDEDDGIAITEPLPAAAAAAPPLLKRVDDGPRLVAQIGLCMVVCSIGFALCGVAAWSMIGVQLHEQ